MQIVFGAGHGDIKQPAFLLDLRRSAGAEIGGHAAIDHIEHEHRLPFLALGGVDRREDKIILVEQRHACLVAGRVRWVERQFGEEALARWIAARDLFELDQVGAPGLGVIVDALQMRVSSPCSGPLWLEVRNSTACWCSGVPDARCSSTRSTMQRAWSASSRTVTSLGFAPDARSVHKFLVKRSRARSITPLAAARIACVER